MPPERKHDHPMTEYDRAITRLGWNQVHAGRMLGVDARTSRRYVSGELTPPNAMMMLLRILVALKRTDEWLLETTKNKIR